MRSGKLLLKNGKAAGADNIPSEALKANIDTIVEMLYPLFARTWEGEELPADWKKGKLPKKGDRSKCSNYSVQRNYFAFCVWKGFQQGHLGKSKGH